MSIDGALHQNDHSGPAKVAGPVFAGKTAWILMSPNIVWLLLFMIVPLGMLFVLSLRKYVPGQGVVEGSWTLENYTRFISDPFYYSVMFETLKLGAGVTLACLVLGFPIAYALSSSKGWKRGLLYFCVILPLLTSAVVRTFGWTILLANSGFLNKVLMAAGIIDGPIRFMYNLTGVIIALTQIMLPFMVLALDAALTNIDRSVLEASRNLGAGRVRMFFKILLPLARPGIVSGSVLVFCMTISAFITPSLVGGAQVKVMPTLIYQQATTLMNWPFGAAIAFIMLIVIVALLVPTLHASDSRRAG